MLIKFISLIVVKASLFRYRCCRKIFIFNNVLHRYIRNICFASIFVYSVISSSNKKSLSIIVTLNQKHSSSNNNFSFSSKKPIFSKVTHSSPGSNSSFSPKKSVFSKVIDNYQPSSIINLLKLIVKFIIIRLNINFVVDIEIDYNYKS